MLSRRDMVGRLAAGAAAVLAVGTASKGFASTQPAADTLTGKGQGKDSVTPVTPASNKNEVDAGPAHTLTNPAPTELLAPLAIGSAVANNWTIAGLSAVVDGTCVLTLENDKGRTHRVHICRNDGKPQGLVYTKHFDLLVMNGGQGDLPTEEGFGKAVATVAHVMAKNENHLGQEAVVAALLPHAERLRRFEGPADRRLR